MWLDLTRGLRERGGARLGARAVCHLLSWNENITCQWNYKLYKQVSTLLNYLSNGQIISIFRQLKVISLPSSRCCKYWVFSTTWSRNQHVQWTERAIKVLSTDTGLFHFLFWDLTHLSLPRWWLQLVLRPRPLPPTS